jgi:putative transposase
VGVTRGRTYGFAPTTTIEGSVTWDNTRFRIKGDEKKLDRRMENRKSLRLKKYDYSQPGYYYVTLCTHNKECLFGYITDEAMVLNSKGQMVEKYWLKLLDKFPNIELVEYIIMPNHIHGIIRLIAPNSILEADPRISMEDKQIQGERMDSSLDQIIQWFKTMTTNTYCEFSH